MAAPAGTLPDSPKKSSNTAAPDTSSSGGTPAGTLPGITDTEETDAAYQFRPDLSFTTYNPNLSFSTERPEGSRQNPVPFLPSANLPATFDQIPQVVEAMKFLETDASFGEKINQVYRSSQDFLQTPEWVQFLSGRYEDLVEADSVMAPIIYGGLAEATKALGQKYPLGEEASGAAAASPNISTFLAENKKRFNAGELDVVTGIMIAVPEKEDTYVIRDYAPTSFPLTSMIGDIVSYPQRSAAPNFREQLAAEATIWLRERPLESDRDKRDFLVWLWKTAEEKTSEHEGRQSHLGIAGAGLDMPKALVTREANKWLVELTAPNDSLDLAHISLGQNSAIAAGFAPGDTNPGFMSGWVGAGLQGVGKGLDVTGSIIGLPASGIRLMAGVEDPWVSLNIAEPFIEELRSASNYELMSGGVDFASWIVLDPINYLAGMGFGAKAVKTVPRGINVSKAQAVSQALIPFYGPRATGVRWGVTSRLTWATFSKTADQMVDAARTSERGRRMYQALQSMSGPEEAVRKIEGLAGSEKLAAMLHDAAVHHDEDFFWETLRVAMHGYNEVSSPQAFAAMEGLLKDSDRRFFQATQTALDDETLDVRSAITGVVGVRADDVDPYDVIDLSRRVDPNAPGFVDEGVMLRAESRGPRLATGEMVGEFPIKDGVIEVRRGAGGTYAAFEGGEFRGMVENVSSPQRQIGVPLEHRGRGIGTTLRNIEGPPVRAAAQSGSAQQAFGSGAGPTVLRRTATSGDGQRKAIINARTGWNELDIGDERFLAWVAEQDPDLAAKFQAGTLGESFRWAPTNLSDKELEMVRRYADDVIDADAIRFNDELLIANRGEKKLLYGTDSGRETPIEGVLGNEMYHQARSHAMRQLLDRKQHDLYLINRMPRTKTLVNTREAIGRWSGLSGRSRIAQFSRRFGRGIRDAAPTDIDFKRPSQGGSDLRRMLRLLGVRQKTIDSIMNDWWSAPSLERRRDVFIDAMQRAGTDINHPHLKYQLVDWNKKHGVQSYARTVDGREIGAATTVDGYETVVPFLKSHMQQSMPLPNIAWLTRELKRYRAAKRLPKRLTAGFGATNDKRKALVKGYKQQLTKKFGAKFLEENSLNDDELMSIAYADVMGYRGREDGLGLVNKMTSVGTRMYGAFHSAFTIGQLAFRPFAWTSRVNLEEHARGWMMGLPTIIRYPAQYMAVMFDSHFVRKFPKQVIQQQDAARHAARLIFDESPTMGQAVKVADSILPGFAKQVEGLDLADSMHIRATFSHELGKALTGGASFADLDGRGIIARRTLRRGQHLKNLGSRLTDTYGIRRQDFNFLEDVPEIVNRSNVWLLSDEMASSSARLDWNDTLRPGDIPVYAEGYGKKLSQTANDPGTRFALARMLEMGTGKGVTDYTPKRFTRTGVWMDVRNNTEDIARHRGIVYETEEQLAEFYLDTLLRDEYIGSLLHPVWGDDPDEKFRIVEEILNRKQFDVEINGTAHSLDLRRDRYASAKGGFRSFFHDQYAAGNFEFPTVAGMFHPLYANYTGKNPFKRFTNFMLQTFGEDISQRLHRQPAYLAEKNRWAKTLTRMGWTQQDADVYGHQKAFEMVNYTFFNNQHTGAIVNRMNKIVPFFSAWAEVMGTWAWKIPSQNYLPLGYARMLHSMDKVMQGWVKLGLVDIGDDGQWHMNLSEAPSQTSPLGRGISRAVHGMLSTPITVVEHTANLARLIGSAADMSDFKEVDFSSWKKDNYSIAIGSPVKINDHGIMGVNQFQFGLGPILNFAASDMMKRLPFAGDTTVITADTLAEVYEQMPSDISAQEVIVANTRVLKKHMGADKFNALFDNNGWLVDPEKIDVTGVQIQVPGSSYMDGVIEDLVFPFGHVETPLGVIRELVPSGLSYIFRGLGVYMDDVPFAEGIITGITGPMEEYQIAAELNKQVIHLEAAEGLITESSRISNEMQKLSKASGYETLEEFRDSVALGSPESVKMSELGEDLEYVNAEILKRATDNAGLALMARGIMGFFAPASPRMYFEEQKVTQQWWTGREMAEAAAVRGDIDWSAALGEVKIDNEEDFTRMVGSVNAWFEDDTGDYAKRWFIEQYPSLYAWTQGTTYWAAGGPPPTRQLDTAFDEIESGRRKPYPADVMIQRIARSAVAATHESQLTRLYGNDPEVQGQLILENWGQYQELRDQYRMKMKGLDMWDAELNGGGYDEWRSRNEDDKPVLYERIEEDLFEIQDAVDELLALSNIVGMSPKDQKTLRGQLSMIVRKYTEILSEVMAELEGEEDFRNPREEFIVRYFLEIAGPYYESREDIYDGLDSAETAEERSVVYENVRALENGMYASHHSLEVNGEKYDVPNELERAWSLRTDYEKDAQIKTWIGQKPEWLSLFAASKIIERDSSISQYLPSSMEEAASYAEATALKNEVIAYARQNPEAMSSYEKNQQLGLIDDQLREHLYARGRYSEVTWLDAWPIERLILAGQLDQELLEIGQWYLGLKGELDAMEKGPESQEGRKRFLAMASFLENQYLPSRPDVEAALDDLGVKMFDETGRYAIYHRLYGGFIGELD